MRSPLSSMAGRSRPSSEQVVAKAPRAASGKCRRFSLPVLGGTSGRLSDWEDESMPGAVSALDPAGAPPIGREAELSELADLTRDLLDDGVQLDFCHCFAPCVVMVENWHSPPVGVFGGAIFGLVGEILR